MKKWGIVVDSSCDYELAVNEESEINFADVPFKMSIGTRDYTDDKNLDLNTMIDDMETAPEICKTSCPSPAAYLDQFEKSKYNIAMTISARLSGSYASACAAKQMFLENNPDGEVFVLDSASAGSGVSIYVDKAIELIEAGLSFEEVVSALKEFRAQRNTVFALCSFKNLVKNGRMSRLSGFIAGALGIWGIGIAVNGEISVKSKVRGINKVLGEFIKDMEENDFHGGVVHVSHCQNEDLANKYKAKVLEKWPNSEVIIVPTKGLCSFYAERHGLIICY